RSQAVTNKGQISTWDIFAAELARAAQQWKASGGAGLRLLTRHETSPTFLDQMARLLTKYPGAKWLEYEPLASSVDEAVYHFDKAQIIVSLGADFLCNPAAGVRYSRDFAAARRPNPTMSRLYVAEPTPTLTGMMADHRFAMRPDEIEQFARDLQSGGGSSKLAQAVAADLRAHSGRGVVVASPVFGSAARQLNDSLGNSGVTVDYQPKPNGGGDLRELTDDIRAGKVETLVIIEGNPVYDAPADFEFAELLRQVPQAIHLGLYSNETAERCPWHVPEKHELEAWSDARAIDGTITILQPMIDPLFAGRSRHELLSLLLEEPPASDYDIVRAFWQKQHSAPDFETLWRKSLHDGIASFQPPLVTSVAPELAASPPPAPQTASGLRLLIGGDSRMYDGRYANNSWLQELPNPSTKIVWDNAALISAATAKRLNLEIGDIVNLKFRGRSARAPIWIQPGQANDCVTVNVGYGRTRAGSVGNGVGFNAYALRTSDAPWGGPGLEIEKTGEHHELVTTQHHWSMEGRDQVRVGTLAMFQRSPSDIVRRQEAALAENETLYPKVAYNGHAWGMTIDLNTCTGCGTCTVACQAENNIPVVGKEQVAMNREMHWIRVDRYYDGDLANPQAFHQPVPCMHCENAPCELVCPVAATVHSSEGLNQMVYNRCIGTRYCSNNCPYKVRRFNFLEYDANQFEQPATRKLMRNPDVSVRSRGVMEKCTYCIQRINAVKIEAQKVNRAIQDGEITPACAQACPAEAIVFGDINDGNSRVAKLRASPLNYGLLAELNTRPRTTYLGRLRNPNPELEHA
ncbi:MAG TPA: 4Fe-4S dicluster domain-containing protein, partial [Chthoniobacterales bacterium]|nr:4Fe-4S dicluster domain-containing protein [Chthoniobacterales bacterium]